MAARFGSSGRSVRSAISATKSLPSSKASSVGALATLLMTAPVMMVMQMSMVVIMADRAAAVQSAIQVALSSPKAALAHIGWTRAERWLKTLSSAELWCIRDVLVAESRTAFPPRLLECIATNDARRAAGELASGARQVLDVGALQHFAAASGFTPVPGYVNLSDWDQLVAADLLHRYGWTGHDSGRGFDAWEVQHQREMLEVMKQIRPPAIVKLSGAPTPQEARNSRGSGVQ